jgi:hypothetical protein
VYIRAAKVTVADSKKQGVGSTAQAPMLHSSFRVPRAVAPRPRLEIPEIEIELHRFAITVPFERLPRNGSTARYWHIRIAGYGGKIDQHEHYEAEYYDGVANTVAPVGQH